MRLQRAVRGGKFFLAKCLIQMGIPMQETDSKGRCCHDGILWRFKVQSQKSLTALDFFRELIQSGLFDDKLSLLNRHQPPYPGLTLCGFNLNIWTLPGMLRVIENEMGWKLNQTPLISRFYRFDWKFVCLDVLDFTLAENRLVIEDMRPFLDCSYGHSFHVFLDQYFKVLGGSFHQPPRSTSQECQHWKEYLQRLLSTMSLDYLVKPHGPGQGSLTPLLTAVRSSVSRVYFSHTNALAFGERKLPIFVKDFLNDVAAAGFDLLAYGRKESELLQRYKKSRPFERFGIIQRKEPQSTPYLIALRYGPCPGDWAFVWDGMVEEFAGDFWHMLENQPLAIPGSWIDDDDDYDDDDDD